MTWFFDLSPGSLDLILVCIYVGIVAACALMLYDRRKLGDFIRALIGAGALDAQSAKTLPELGYEKSGAVRRALRGRGIFAGLVYEASETPVYDREDHAQPIYREGFDPETARFYLPQPLRYRAEVRFEKKGSHVMALVVGAIAFAVVIFLIMLFKEKILAAVRDWFTAMSS